MRTLALLGLLLCPEAASASIILDAHVEHSPLHRERIPIAEDRRVTEVPYAVEFVARNTGELASIDLWLAARLPRHFPASPVILELWRDFELLGVDTAGADVPVAWGNGVLGYSRHSFVFSGVDLEAGQSYQWMAYSPTESGGTYLETDSEWEGLAGHVVYSVFVEGLAGDVDDDGTVDLTDFGFLKDAFGSSMASADFDASGRVDLADFGILKENFGKSAATAVPEPSTWFLASLAGLSVVAKRRRSRRWHPSCGLAARIKSRIDRGDIEVRLCDLRVFARSLRSSSCLSGSNLTSENKGRRRHSAVTRR